MGSTLTEALRETLALFENSGEPWTTTEVADRLGLGRRGAYERLERLVEDGRLESKKVGGSGRVWWRRSGDEPLVPPSATDRKSASRDDGDLRRLYSVIFNETFQFIGLLETDGTVIEANDAALSFGGLTRDEVVGAPFWEADWWQTAERTGERLRDAIERAADGEFVRYEAEVQGEDRTAIIDFSLRPVTDDQGEVTVLVPEGRDITERKRRERELERERDLIDRILETSPVGIQVLDRDGSVTRRNERATDMVEIPVEDSFSRVLETGDPVFDNQTKVAAPDGGDRWLSVNAAPIFDEDGEVERVVTTGEDVTPLKERARRLERQRDDLEAELEEVLGRISDGFYGLDEELRFTYVNGRAERLLGVEASSVLEQDIRGTVPVTDRFEAALTEALENGESVSFEEYYEPLEAWFENAIYPSQTGVSVYFRDVTDRKERERELEQFEAIVETVNDGVYVIDEDGYFTFANDHLASMLDRPVESIVGSHASDLLQDHPVEVGEEVDRKLRTGDEDGATVEVEITDSNGDPFYAETTFALLPERSGRVGVVRDVTDRRERERELRDRVRQQEAVADLGQQALESSDLEALMAEATELVADAFDNQYCKLLELDEDAEQLLLREGVGWEEGTVGTATVSAAGTDSQAAYTLSTGPVVVEDFAADPRFSGPDLLVEHGVRSGISTFVGPPDDPWGILGTHDTDATAFSERDVAFVQSVANVLATAIERHENEQVLVQQRERLTALSRFNSVVHDITDAVIDKSTREEVEAIVCDHLTDADAYAFAWVAEVDPQTDSVTPRTEAGVDGYLEGIPLSADPEDPFGRGPAGQAIREGATQVSTDVFEDPAAEHLREYATEYDFRSFAAIPIIHEGSIYGLLGIHSTRAGAFGRAERHVVGRLGEVVGHAIASIERKRALTSDEVTEIEFTVPDFLDTLGVDPNTGGTITFDRLVALDDETHLVYGTVDGEAVDTLEALVDEHPEVRALASIDREDDPARFELRSTASLPSIVSSHGGYTREARIEDGDLTSTVHFPPSVSTRRIVDAVRELYPSTRLVTRRQVTRRDEPLARIHRAVTDDLTERQRTALETAVYSGYFQWPRDASAKDIAGSLGIAPPTFHQHLRKAQRKVFDSLYSTPASS